MSQNQGIPSTHCRTLRRSLISPAAQFFTGVATICTKLFNAVEVSFGLLVHLDR